MADNVAVTAGAGTTVAADEVVDGTLGTVKVQFVKIMDGTLDGTTKLKIQAEDATVDSGDAGILAMVKRNDTPANLSGTDGDAEVLQVSGGKLWVSPLGFPVSVQTDITRPADTTAYAANDCLSDSTSAPTSGGFTLTNICRKSGGSVLITDVIVTSSADAATLLQGEVFIFNTSVTNVNDNSAFVVSDTEIKTCVAKVAFTLEDAGNNGFAHVQNLNIVATASGSANLRFLIRVKNAYTPANAEVLTVIVKGIQLD
jgi:hypothetical protein